VTGFPKPVRDIITARAKGGCEICFFAIPDQIHHRRPRGAGGSKRADTNTASNGIAICAACHRMVESNRTEAFTNGWLVRQGHDPAAVPVLRYGSDWVQLNNDGTTKEVTHGGK
jgi:hypothetical protein